MFFLVQIIARYYMIIHKPVQKRDRGRYLSTRRQANRIRLSDFPLKSSPKGDNVDLIKIRSDFICMY